MIIGRLPAGQIYSEQLIPLAFGGLAPFTVLQSRSHEVWARFFASTLEDRLRYTPSDCFETFPFPQDFETLPTLEAAGHAYYDHRAALMIARNEGMTKTYNRFHDRSESAADICRLRELHAEMDRAVLTAYGWADLAASASPEFIEQEADEGKKPKTRFDWPQEFKDEILARLLALNAERAEAERAAGLTASDKDDEEQNDDSDDK